MTEKTQGDVWTMIDAERRRDRWIRRVSVVAWSVAGTILLVFAAISATRIADTMQRVEVGIMPSGAVYDAAMPLLIVVGLISLLIAVLATVGIFLRLRTASLHEIQLRLAALEQMLVERDKVERA